MPQISGPNGELKNTRQDMIIGLFNRISGDDYVENQKELLIDSICIFLEDPTDCEKNVESYWNSFSDGLFREKSALEFCEYPENDCHKERFGCWIFSKKNYVFIIFIISEIGIVILAYLI